MQASLWQDDRDRLSAKYLILHLLLRQEHDTVENDICGVKRPRSETIDGQQNLPRVLNELFWHAEAHRNSRIEFSELLYECLFAIDLNLALSQVAKEDAS